MRVWPLREGDYGRRMSGPSSARCELYGAIERENWEGVWVVALGDVQVKEGKEVSDGLREVECE